MFTTRRSILFARASALNNKAGGGGGGGRGFGASARTSSQSVLDTFLQIQLGTWTPTAQTARQVLVAHFAPKLAGMQLNEAKLAAMDPKKVTKLLRQALYEQYLAVPFTVVTFDLEFTGIPTFTSSSVSSSSSISSFPSITTSSSSQQQQQQHQQENQDQEQQQQQMVSSSSDSVPTEDIVELALFDPDHKRTFSQLIQPYNHHCMSDTAAAMTGISDKMLAEAEEKGDALPLVNSWNKAMDFIEETIELNLKERMKQQLAEEQAFAFGMSHNNNTNSPNNNNNDNNQSSTGNDEKKLSKNKKKSSSTSHQQQEEEEGNTDEDSPSCFWKYPDERVLLISHGARLADIGMLSWVQTLKGARPLPPNTTFGDSLLYCKDLHRRRPVTKDKWPPAWSLEDISAFLGLKTTTLHRAGPDSILTWESLYHTLDRYGDSDGLTPRQQLVGRFFDQEAKGGLSEIDVQAQNSRRQQQQQDGVGGGMHRSPSAPSSSSSSSSSASSSASTITMAEAPEEQYVIDSSTSNRRKSPSDKRK